MATSALGMRAAQEVLAAHTRRHYSQTLARRISRVDAELRKARRCVKLQDARGPGSAQTKVGGLIGADAERLEFVARAPVLTMSRPAHQRSSPRCSNHGALCNRRSLKVSHTRTLRVARQDTPGGVFSRFLTLRQLSWAGASGAYGHGLRDLAEFSRDPCRRTARSPHKRNSGLHEEKYGAMAPSGISRESGSNQAGWK